MASPAIQRCTWADSLVAGERQEPDNFQSNGSTRHRILRTAQPVSGSADHRKNLARAVGPMPGHGGATAQRQFCTQLLTGRIHEMKAMKKIIRLGVVGCGYWGPNLIRNLHQLPDCQLKVICDISEARLRHMTRLYPGVTTTTDFDELLNDAELDAIVVATPARFHYQMGKACLEAGKHLFVEKPMARTSVEARELNAIAKKRGLVVMVGHTFLFSPA